MSAIDSVARVRSAIQEASVALVERETLVELVVLAAVAREHLLVLGPPGTGKSEAVRRIARRLGGTYFEYLVGRFTEPTEIFGPIDATFSAEALPVELAHMRRRLVAALAKTDVAPPAAAGS